LLQIAPIGALASHLDHADDVPDLAVRPCLRGPGSNEASRGTSSPASQSACRGCPRPPVRAPPLQAARPASRSAFDLRSPSRAGRGAKSDSTALTGEADEPNLLGHLEREAETIGARHCPERVQLSGHAADDVSWGRRILQLKSLSHPPLPATGRPRRDRRPACRLATENRMRPACDRQLPAVEPTASRRRSCRRRRGSGIGRRVR
jgi:hypothetical protein